MKKRSGVLRSILKITVYAVCAVLTALVVFIMITNAQKKPTFIFGHTALWVMTPSMEPEIPEKSYILVKKAAAEDVRLNDVISFYSKDPALDGALNTHRVVEIVGDHEGFVTKGDKNSSVDRYTVKAEDVCGIYVGKLFLLTAIGRLTSTWAGAVIVLLAVAAIVFAAHFKEISAYVKKRFGKNKTKNR